MPPCKGPKNPKTRPTVVELHPKRKQIERELAEGNQISTISKKYGVSRQALQGYRRNRLPSKLIKAVERQDITDAQHLFQVILKACQRMEKLSDACDEYLQDPDDVSKYFLGEHEQEIIVVGERTDGNGKRFKVKKPLSVIIRELEGKGYQIEKLKSNTTDPRMLLVRTSEALTKQMETLVNAWRAIDQGKSSFIGTPAWQEVVAIILKSTEKFPEARRAITDGLSKITS